jgi:hypothetical protein
MSLRTFSLALWVTLAACGSAGGEDKVATAAPDDRIECATGGATDFAKACAVERNAEGTTLTIRHADGGFRRLALGADMALSTADGATLLDGKALPDGRLEVAVDGDRYRLPNK